METVNVSSLLMTLGTLTDTQLLRSRAIPIISFVAGAFRIDLRFEWRFEGFSMALLAGEVSLKILRFFEGRYLSFHMMRPIVSKPSTQAANAPNVKAIPALGYA